MASHPRILTCETNNLGDLVQRTVADSSTMFTHIQLWYPSKPIERWYHATKWHVIADIAKLIHRGRVPQSLALSTAYGCQSGKVVRGFLAACPLPPVVHCFADFSVDGLLEAAAFFDQAKQAGCLPVWAGITDAFLSTLSPSHALALTIPDERMTHRAKRAAAALGLHQSLAFKLLGSGRALHLEGMLAHARQSPAARRVLRSQAGSNPQ